MVLPVAADHESSTDAVFAGAVMRGLSQGWLPGLAWLDGGDLGRSFLGFEPDLVIEGDNLAQLDEVDNRWRADPSRVWIGWMTYELGSDRILGRGPGRGPRPGLCMRRFSSVIERSPQGQHRIHGGAESAERLQSVFRRAASGSTTTSPPWPLEKVQPRLSGEEYRERVSRARETIAAGDAHQIHLSQSFGARWKATAPPGTPVRVACAYGNLRERWPAGMGAVLEADRDTWFLSNSPETLVDVRLGEGRDGAMLARAWPTEDTCPRGADPAADEAAREQLRAGGKDRAEHSVTVERFREDLGQLAVPGTVQIRAEPELRTLATEHHLITEVTASVPQGTTLRAMVEALFPGAGITGSPKRRAVELIDELEEHARGVYCGAIVVLEPGGLRMSIPIRTAVIDRYGLDMCAGGTIVGDTDPESECLETVSATEGFCGQ